MFNEKATWPLERGGCTTRVGYIKRQECSPGGHKIHSQPKGKKACSNHSEMWTLMRIWTSIRSLLLQSLLSKEEEPPPPPHIQPLITDVDTDITEAGEKPPHVLGLGTSLAQRWQGEGDFVYGFVYIAPSSLELGGELGKQMNTKIKDGHLQAKEGASGGIRPAHILISNF